MNEQNGIIALVGGRIEGDFEASQAENDLLKARIERLEEVLSNIEKGCSFPEDSVQRAIRDVARATLYEGKEKT